jgi:DNA-binding GntR family transcriptional regulator
MERAMPKKYSQTPLEDSSLGQQVADVIREAILTGGISPGDKILERQLAEELGVSRVPVREALRTLQQQGLLEARPRHGAYVRALDGKMAEDTLWVRNALHVSAVEQALEKLDPAGWDALCDRLEQALEPMRRLLDDYADRSDIRSATARLDIAWWSLLIQAADNEILSRLWEDVALMSRILVRRVTGLPSRDEWEFTIAEHQAIVEALRRRDLDECKCAVSIHVHLEEYRGLHFRTKESVL